MSDLTPEVLDRLEALLPLVETGSRLNPHAARELLEAAPVLIAAVREADEQVSMLCARSGRCWRIES